jgi:pilus assembly protein CpaB
MLVALGLAAYAWVVSSRMAAQQKAAQARMLPVVVAQARIPAGSQITREMLKVSMFPTRPEGAFSDLGEVVGKVTSTDISVGESIHQSHLGGGLRAMLQHIDPNERAVAVRVDEVVAVGNRLVPGDWVDVFVTLHRNNTEIIDTQSRLLLERLQVLSFGSKDVGGAKPASEGASTPASTARSGETPKTAVLAVKLADIDKLVLAAESGRLILALRPHAQPQAPEATVMPAAATGAQKDAAPAPAVVAQAGPPLTLKQLVGSPTSAPPAARSAGGKAGKGGGKPADTVIVMHGLSEKTVRVGASNEARP